MRIEEAEIPGWVEELEYGKHPFSPSCFEGTPAEGRMPGKDRMAWMAIDWCGNIVGVEEADWLELPEGFDPETQKLVWKRKEGVIITEKAPASP